MANTWFVDRDGEERGPFTGQQLKTMAGKGEIKPTDLIRRDDSKDWRLASSVKGLFEPVAAPRPLQPPPPPAQPTGIRPTETPGENTVPIWTNPVLISASVVLCFPVGLVLVWRHPTWSKAVKWTWTGAVGVFFFIAFIGGTILQENAKRELAEAETLWQAGNKAAAVEKYRPLLRNPNLIPDHDRPLVFGRVIDFDVENGNSGSAKHLIEEAAKHKITPSVNTEQGKKLLAERQAEIARAEAGKKEQQANSEADKRRKESLAKPTTRDKLRQADRDETVTANRLFSEFRSNEVTANAKYKGKTIMVEGTVHSVEAGGALGSDSIILEGSFAGSADIRCYLTRDNAEEVKKIRTGSVVRIQGQCDGMTFTMVTMSKCICVVMIE